jgi:DNA (cytosine-5)-methyltransferase 1
VEGVKPRLLDAFCGEGGAGMGYHRAGWDVFGVDNSPARLARYPFDSHCGDAVEFILENGHEFDAGHGSPTCTGYSRGTAAIPDRVARYDRLIPAVRAAFEEIGLPYVIENVADARPELRTPILLCSRMFDLSAVDEDGTALVVDRHRLFESNVLLLAPEHLPHDRSLQVAGSYGGARRDKREAREIRRGGYVPSADVQRALLDTPWMSEKGCQLSIPPAYTEHIGAQLLAAIEVAA